MRFCGIMLGARLAAAAQIRARVAVGAPRSPDGFHGDAFTRWKYRRWRPGSAVGRCRASEACVTLQIDLSFALRTRPRAASPAVAAACARSIRAPACREQGDADEVRAHYRQLDLIPRHDAACDAATHHGAMQGRALPLRASRC